MESIRRARRETGGRLRKLQRKTFCNQNILQKLWVQPCLLHANIRVEKQPTRHPSYSRIVLPCLESSWSSSENEKCKNKGLEVSLPTTPPEGGKRWQTDWSMSFKCHSHYCMQESQLCAQRSIHSTNITQCYTNSLPLAQLMSRNVTQTLTSTCSVNVTQCYTNTHFHLLS